MPAEFETLVRPHLEALLEPGEALHGVIAANRQKTFSGRLYAIGVTERRLILQPLNRRIEPDGEPVSLRPEQVVASEVEGAGGGWWTETAVQMDRAALTLKLRSTDGASWKLIMMRGGEGRLARLGGGGAQEAGIEALAAWFAARG